MSQARVGTTNATAVGTVTGGFLENGGIVKEFIKII